MSAQLKLHWLFRNLGSDVGSAFAVVALIRCGRSRGNHRQVGGVTPGIGGLIDCAMYKSEKAKLKARLEDWWLQFIYSSNFWPMRFHDHNLGPAQRSRI